LGVIEWAPKWPEPTWIWAFNNLALVILVEEALFRGYIQGGLSKRFKSTPNGDSLALVLAALLFGLLHISSGPLWMVLASLAGLGYGFAYRFGGLLAAICAHFMLNMVHFFLFTYPMLAG
jgi:membrane protease YdiL (CAAX protease family)